MPDYDCVIVGSGHNALICALALSAAGQQVLVLEKAEKIGGAMRTAELTLPGFQHDVCATNVGRLRLCPVYQAHKTRFEELGVRFINNQHAFASAFDHGRPACVFTDRATTEAGIASFSQADLSGWRALARIYESGAKQISGLQQSAFPSAQMWKVLGRLALKPGVSSTLLKLALITPRSFIDRYIGSAQVKSLIAPWALHSDFGPDTRGGAAFAFVMAMTGYANGISIAAGGAGKITEALRLLIEENGGRILSSAEVTRIHVRGGGAAAVETAAGDVISAATIVAGVTPHNLFGRIVSVDDVPAGFMARIRRFRYGIGTFVLHLALAGKLQWRAASMLSDFNTVHIGATVEELDLTYRQSLVGLIPSRPLLIVSQPSSLDPSRSPAGRHVARIHSRAFPALISGDAADQIQGRKWDEVKEAVADRLLNILQEHAPNLRDVLLDRRAVSPLDLEHDNPNLVGGDCASGSQHLAQNYFCRPLLGWSRYRTPIKNLYMLGSSTWPGSGIHGSSGYLLSEILLR